MVSQIQSIPAQGKISLSLMTFFSNGTLVFIEQLSRLYYFEERALSSPVKEVTRTVLVFNCTIN
jgi:hypothetical protein